MANHKIAQLTSDYPFTDTPKTVALPTDNKRETQFVVERIQGRAWLEQQQDLLAFFQQQKQWMNAANVAALMFEALPTQHDVAAVAAKLYLKAHQPRLAWYYARQAATALTQDENLLLSLAEAQYLSEDNDAAVATLNRILAFAPDNTRASHYLKQLTGS